jgi:PTS system nitrogen regulatory IIA component
MKFTEFLSLESIFVDIEADSKKNVFKILGNLFAKKNASLASTIINRLNERERLGSTSVGNGVAIPHTKVGELKQTMVIFLKLQNGVDFAAEDDKNVDLVFSIIAPESSQSEHLLILSSISNFLRKKSNVDDIRKLESAEEIYSLLSKS